MEILLFNKNPDKQNRNSFIFSSYTPPGIREITMNDYTNLKAMNKISKGAKIRTRYNQVPHLTQNTFILEYRLDGTSKNCVRRAAGQCSRKTLFTDIDT